MFSIYQKTIEQKLMFSGKGLHTGEYSELTVYPAPEDTGIIFIKNNVQIPATAINVVETSFCTQIELEGQRVKTIEHFMSAVAALQLTNLICEINGPEVPILDGSAWPFYFGLKSTGIIHQKKYQQIAVIKKPVELQHGTSIAGLYPFNDQLYDLTVDYSDSIVSSAGLQGQFSFRLDNYETEIARARTYGFMKDLPFYQKNNLAQGADLSNTLVFDDKEVLNPDGLRFKNEVVRHKILDAIGDLALIGMPFWGLYKAIRPGHGLNIQMIKSAFERNAFEIVPVAELSKYTVNIDAINCA